MLAPGFAFPGEPALGGGVVDLGCVADDAGGELGVLPPEPVAGALPVLPPLLCANAGAAIAATIAVLATTLMTRDAIVCLLGATRSS